MSTQSMSLAFQALLIPFKRIMPVVEKCRRPDIMDRLSWMVGCVALLVSLDNLPLVGVVGCFPSRWGWAGGPRGTTLDAAIVSLSLAPLLFKVLPSSVRKPLERERVTATAALALLGAVLLSCSFVGLGLYGPLTSFDAGIVVGQLLVGTVLSSLIVDVANIMTGYANCLAAAVAADVCGSLMFALIGRSGLIPALFTSIASVSKAPAVFASAGGLLLVPIAMILFADYRIELNVSSIRAPGMKLPPLPTAVHDIFWALPLGAALSTGTALLAAAKARSQQVAVAVACVHGFQGDIRGDGPFTIPRLFPLVDFLSQLNLVVVAVVLTLGFSVAAALLTGCAVEAKGQQFKRDGLVLKGGRGDGSDFVKRMSGWAATAQPLGGVAVALISCAADALGVPVGGLALCFAWATAKDIVEVARNEAIASQVGAGLSHVAARKM